MSRVYAVSKNSLLVFKYNTTRKKHSPSPEFNSMNFFAVIIFLHCITFTVQERPDTASLCNANFKYNETSNMCVEEFPSDPSSGPKKPVEPPDLPGDPLQPPPTNLPPEMPDAEPPKPDNKPTKKVDAPSNGENDENLAAELPTKKPASNKPEPSAATTTTTTTTLYSSSTVKVTVAPSSTTEPKTRAISTPSPPTPGGGAAANPPPKQDQTTAKPTSSKTQPPDSKIPVDPLAPVPLPPDVSKPANPADKGNSNGKTPETPNAEGPKEDSPPNPEGPQDELSPPDTQDKPSVGGGPPKDDEALPSDPEETKVAPPLEIQSPAKPPPTVNTKDGAAKDPAAQVPNEPKATPVSQDPHKIDKSKDKDKENQLPPANDASTVATPPKSIEKESPKSVNTNVSSNIPTSDVSKQNESSNSSVLPKSDNKPNEILTLAPKTDKPTDAPKTNISKSDNIPPETSETNEHKNESGESSKKLPENEPKNKGSNEITKSDKNPVVTSTVAPKPEPKTDNKVDDKPPDQTKSSSTVAPITDKVTTAPVTDKVTTAPVTDKVTTAPITEKVTKAPVTDKVTKAPITDKVTTPKTEKPTDAPTTVKSNEPKDPIPDNPNVPKTEETPEEPEVKPNTKPDPDAQGVGEGEGDEDAGRIKLEPRITSSAGTDQSKLTGEEDYTCIECDDSPAYSAKQCTSQGGSGAFINLCGICVGGSTKRVVTFGVNTCGMCASADPWCSPGCGGDSTFSRDNCGRCLAKDDVTRDKCLSVSRATPSLLDRCGDRMTSVTLTGAGLNIISMSGAKCLLKQASETLQDVVKRITPRDQATEIEIMLPARGRYNVQCLEASGAPMPLQHGPVISVVDSSMLAVTSVSPASVTLYSEIQLKATVPGSVTGQLLLCAIWTQNPSTLVLMVPGIATSGGQVICARTQIHVAGHLLLRVAASEPAALNSARCAASAEVQVKAPAPVLQNVLLSPDLRSLWFEFDHSISAPSSCKEIFSATSLTLLGQDAWCRVVGSRLEVMLAETHQVRPTSKLQIIVGNSIRRAGVMDLDMAESLPGLFTSVAVHPLTRAAPRYRLLPLSPACEKGANRELRIISEDGRSLNVSVRVAFAGKGPSDQRRNLMFWRTMRDLGLNIESSLQAGRLLVNTKQLQNDLEYKLTVSGADILGSRGEERDVLLRTDISGSTSTTLHVIAPNSARPDAELRAEALLVTCDTALMPPARVDYIWSVIAAGGPLPISAPQGRVLRLSPFSVKGGVAHQISCAAYLGPDRTKPIATGSAVVRVSSRGVRAVITTSSLTIGTGQVLQLDASMSRDLDGGAGPLQFSWRCEREGSPCAVPNAAAKSLDSTFQQQMSVPMLRLPPGALAVGDHLFTVTVTRVGSSGSGKVSTAQCKVRVARGNPPSLRLVTRDITRLDSSYPQGLLIASRSEDMRGRCWARWRSLIRHSGDVSLILDESFIMWEDTKDNHIYARDVPLMIPTGQLVQGAWHRLQLEASCSSAPARLALQRASLEIEVFVARAPIAAALQVSPSTGMALRTQFTLSVSQEAVTSEDSMPLMYEFGWREAGQMRVQPLHSSLYILSVTSVLPCERSSRECTLVPVLRVCNTLGLCVTSEASPIKVTLPAALTQEDISDVGDRVNSLLGSRQFGAALVLANGALKTVQGIPGAEQQEEDLAERVETAFLSTLADMESRLGSSQESLKEALHFLERENGVLKEHAPSERVQNALSMFKQRVMESLRGLVVSKVRSTPRRVVSNKVGRHAWPRPRRHLITNKPITEHEINVLLDMSERLILDSQHAEAERDRLSSDLLTYSEGICTGFTYLGQQMIASSQVASLVVKGVNSQLTQVTLPRFKPNDADPKPLAYIMTSGTGSAKCLASSAVLDQPANTTFRGLYRRSTVVRVTLLGAESKEVNIALRFLIPLLEEVENIQCSKFVEGAWNSDSCRILEKPTPYKPYLRCYCRSSGGYFSAISPGSLEITSEIQQNVISETSLPVHLSILTSEASTPALTTSPPVLTSQLPELISQTPIDLYSQLFSTNTPIDQLAQQNDILPSYSNVSLSSDYNEHLEQLPSTSLYDTYMTEQNIINYDNSNQNPSDSHLNYPGIMTDNPNESFSYSPKNFGSTALQSIDNHRQSDTTRHFNYYETFSNAMTDKSESSTPKVYSDKFTTPRGHIELDDQGLLAQMQDETYPGIQKQTKPIFNSKPQRFTSFVLTFNVLDVIPVGEVPALEMRIKKQIAQQARLPEDAITEVTWEKGSVTLRLEWSREEIARRGVMEISQLLKYGRLELRGMDGMRLNIPPQAAGGDSGITPPEPVPVTPVVTNPGTSLPPTASPTTGPASTATSPTQGNPAQPAPGEPPVEKYPDVYIDDDWSATQEAVPLTALVFAGSALSVFIVLGIALRACLVLRHSNTTAVWGKLNSHQHPYKKSSSNISSDSSNPRLYRDIERPEEILAAIAQLSQATPNLLSPVEQPGEKSEGFSHSIHLMLGMSGEHKVMTSPELTLHHSPSVFQTRPGDLEMSRDKKRLIASWQEFKTRPNSTTTSHNKTNN